MLRRGFWVVGLVVVTTVACSVPIHHGLDEAGANEILAALDRTGVGAEKRPDDGMGGAGFTIRVARSDTARALEVLRGLGLPRGKQRGFAEIYGQPSLIPTASEERARYLGALCGEIERTLQTVEGVISVRAHLVLPETDSLALDGKPRTPAKAAVLIKMRAGRPPISDADVQRLVAGSVPELDPTAVAVIVTAGPDPAAPGASVAPARTSSLLAPDTRIVLVAVASGGLALGAVLAGLLLFTARRLAALQRERSR